MIRVSAEVGGQLVVISSHAFSRWRERCASQFTTLNEADLETALRERGEIHPDPPEGTHPAHALETDGWLRIDNTDAVFPLVEKDDGALLATTCIRRRIGGRSGMVGKVYTWQDRTWRVEARWRSLSVDDPVTHVASCCGHVALDPRDSPDDMIGEDSYCGSCGAQWTETRPAGHQEINGWFPGGRRSIRNVLIEDVETGERVVRPFRGLRRPVPDSGDDNT